MASSSKAAKSRQDILNSVPPRNDNSTPSANDGLTITKPRGLFTRIKRKLFSRFSKKAVEQNDTQVDPPSLLSGFQEASQVAPPSLLLGFQEALRSLQEAQSLRQPSTKLTFADTSTEGNQEDSEETYFTWAAPASRNEKSEDDKSTKDNSSLSKQEDEDLSLQPPKTPWQLEMVDAADPSEAKLPRDKVATVDPFKADSSWYRLDAPFEAEWPLETAAAADTFKAESPWNKVDAVDPPEAKLSRDKVAAVDPSKAKSPWKELDAIDPAKESRDAANIAEIKTKMDRLAKILPNVNERSLPYLSMFKEYKELEGSLGLIESPALPPPSADRAPPTRRSRKANSAFEEVPRLGSEQSTSAALVPREAQDSQVISGLSTLPSTGYDRLIDSPEEENEESGQDSESTCKHPLSDRRPGSYECYDCGYLMPYYWCKCRRCSRRLCERCAKYRGGSVWGHRGSSR